MSDRLEQVLLTDVPEFLDGWVLKSSVPCGGLIHHVDMNPFNSTKMIIYTKGRDNAQKIASMLDGYNLYGSVIRTRYAFIKPGEASKAMTNYITGGGIQAKIDNKYDYDDKTVGGHFDSLLRPDQTRYNQPAAVLHYEDEKLRPERRRRSSTTASFSEVLEDAQRGESIGRLSSKTSSGGSCRSKDSQSRNSTDEKNDASPWCRFCLRSGHETWLCESNAEYYNVGFTVKGKSPTGYQWPESCLVQVQGLCAGPIIKLIEKYHLQTEEMNREEIRIMFAWLTNYFLCHNCGATGHQYFERLCKYLPLEYPVTEEMVHYSRKPFCRRMKGIRDKLSFGELQQHAHAANDKFRALMSIKYELPLYSDRREEKHSKRRHKDPFAEPRNEGRNHPKTSDSTDLFPPVKRIKRERRRDHSQDTD